MIVSALMPASVEDVHPLEGLDNSVDSGDLSSLAAMSNFFFRKILLDDVSIQRQIAKMYLLDYAKAAIIIYCRAKMLTRLS